MSVYAIVGAQFGSEGKGAIAAWYAKTKWVDVWVRTGGPNAGHTFHDQDGQRRVVQSLPVGVVDPDSILVLGPGAVIDPAQLELELSEWPDARDRLLIDQNATILLPHHHDIEGGVSGRAHQLIGSTGHGVGIARIGRIARNALGVMVGNMPVVGMIAAEAAECGILDGGIKLTDTGRFLRSTAKVGQIMLEGTQGSGLSLVHGPWPFVTSADTNVGQLMVDAGLPPNILSGCLLVVRTFPIRVAGQSGPLPNETTWEELGLEPEYTTVTKKPRRVAYIDYEQVKRAIAINGTRALAVTFLDYIDRPCRDKEPTGVARLWMNKLEWETKGKCVLAGTGPDSVYQTSAFDWDF